jgi:hypothetical protein
MAKFIVEARTRESRGHNCGSRWRVDESPDFPQKGDAIYTTGKPILVENRSHRAVGDEKMLALEIVVTTSEFSTLMADSTWHEQPEMAVAA